MTGARLARSRFIALMLAPAVLLLAGLTIIPFIVGVAMSFTDYSLLRHGEYSFVGLDNYAHLFSSAEFWTSLRITVIFTVSALAIQLVVGVGIAVLLHRETRLAPFLRPIYLLPMAITPVAATFTFRMMFNPSLGVLNHLVQSLGLPPQDWLGSPNLALISLIIVDSWQWTPFILLIAASGLAAMDEEPLEAAQMDGASSFALLFHHVLPNLAPFLSVAVMFRAIDAFKTFDIIFVLTGGGPGIATRTLNIMAYKHGIEFLSLGYAAAITLVMLVFTILAAQIFLRRAKLLQPKAPL